MPICLIAHVIRYNDKLVIGRDGELLLKLRGDLAFFRRITTGAGGGGVVVMGKRTWDSLPPGRRPLPGRVNIVITSDRTIHSNILDLFRLKNDGPFFMSLETFRWLYILSRRCMNVFVIGGGQLYNTFLNGDLGETFLPERLYFTEVVNYVFPKGESPKDNPDRYTFMNPPDCRYTPLYVSEPQYSKHHRYYYLCYRGGNVANRPTPDIQYRQLCRRVLTHGRSRDDRTGVGTISIFGDQVHYDISHTLPLLTTKTVPWRSVIGELLWFIRGDTDARILQRGGIKIWDGNTSRAFLDSRGLSDYPEGILGPGYGWQWRFFGGDYTPADADTNSMSQERLDELRGLSFDQLAYIENELRTNPTSRRIMMCYWNPPDFDKTALLPCHYSCQFYVSHPSHSEHDPRPTLDCHFTMRSNDLFLGHPFNIASYAALTHILAMRLDMQPGKLVYTGGDVHVYQNHILQLEEQFSRAPRPSPFLRISPDVKTKRWRDITVDDFDIIGYYPHSAIRGVMAV
jgi:thymidylate synthase